ncbi:MAG: TonB-dependent receptor [Candidatus Omnitrophica bacterium]|nr:TonB-dependent receptor [Candidatus Omnitrophota bacterium]
MKKFLSFWLAFFVITLNLTVAVSAQEETVGKPSADTQTLQEVTVKAPKADPNNPFLADVQGTKIYAGKKTTSIRLNDLPETTNNNYRQALVKIPGLLVSEETTPLFSLGYRGLNPDRAQFMQVLKDGIPIQADMFGYPESYYTPPLESIERIEFIRGGSALLYGPQPGGALNYITHEPILDKKFTAYSQNVFGSDNYFSTYEAISGSVNPLGYYAYFHERQGDGFRLANSNFEVISSGIKATINQTGDSRLKMTYDEYHEEHGEPGGLTRAQFDNDPSVNTLRFDHFRMERYYGTLAYEKDLSDTGRFDFKLYGGRYRRWSKRQTGSGFGTTPTGNFMDIQDQNFYNLGFEPRLRLDYEFLNGEHTLTFGTDTFMSHSPREDSRGSLDADAGAIRQSARRNTWYFSAFAENLFKWGKFKITPAARMEHVWQRTHETIDVVQTGKGLDEGKNFDFAPLFGLGIAYEAAKTVEVYTNISQSYRPKLFTQFVPTGSGETVEGDLEEGKGWQYDIGLRGRPRPYLSWDISYFILKFDNQIGKEGSVFRNGGDAFHHGVELANEIDFVGLLDDMNKTDHAKTIGSLSAFSALTVLDAEYKEGPFKGRQPAFAPKYNLRFGTNYRWRDRVKLSLISTFIGEHFADDASTANRFIPSYKVWDLLGEINLLKNLYDQFDLGIFGGINNLFDEHYYARVTSTGIDPAYGRNVYGGVKVNWG